MIFPLGKSDIVGCLQAQAAGRLGHSLGNENESVQFDVGKSSGGDSSIST